MTRGLAPANETQEAAEGFVFDVQGFSVHDGPGCRTVVFLKGCPLACFWCANPEAIDHRATPMVTLERCDGCGRCAPACLFGAVAVDGGAPTFDSDACGRCPDHACVRSCWSEAISVVGRKVTVAELMQVFKRDRHYWGADGGITLTGGEPLAQRRFVHDLLRECAAQYIDTAIETCGHAPWAAYEECLPYLDFVFFDLKHLARDLHRSGTGRSNDLVLENARRLAAGFPGRLVFRTPLVPGFNTGLDHLGALADFIASLGRPDLEANLLPVHHMARQKYSKMGRDYPMPALPACDEGALQKAHDTFVSRGIACYIGDDTPF